MPTVSALMLASDVESIMAGEARRRKAQVLDRVQLPVMVLAATAATIWLSTIPRINPQEIDDVGLISALPLQFFLALGLLSVSFALTLWVRPLNIVAVAAQLTILAAILFGTPALVEGTTRFAPAWKHFGVVEYIARTGQVDPAIDAYFNWPGFFAYGALISETTGLHDLQGIALWTPVLSNLLYIGPLYMMYTAVTGDRRLVWFAIWIFFLANWINQDYFAPQAFAYLLYLIILGILMRWFRPTKAANARGSGAPVAWMLDRWPSSWPGSGWLVQLREWLEPDDAQPVNSRPGQRTGLLAIVIVLYAAIVSSHQLTPVATLTSVTALMLFNRCVTRSLPITMGIMFAFWTAFVATAYFSGHFQHVAGQVGQVSQTLDQSVTHRISGSPGHQLVVQVRLLTTLCIWGLAFLGAARRLLRRHWDTDISLMLLASAPFALLGMQSYGGEILLRVYLFSLAPVAFFVAALFFTTPERGRSLLTTAPMALLCLGLAGAFFITRYGNELMDYYSPSEIAAVEYVYQTAPADSLLLTASPNLPWKFARYEQFDHESIVDNLDSIPFSERDQMAAIAQWIDEQARRDQYQAAFVVLTRSQKEGTRMFGEFPAGALDQLQQILVGSYHAQVVVEHEDAVVLQMPNSGGGEAP